VILVAIAGAHDLHVSRLHGLKGAVYGDSFQSNLHDDNVFQVGDLCCTVVTVASLHRQGLCIATTKVIVRTGWLG
jgi:hypothetical protein